MTRDHNQHVLDTVSNQGPAVLIIDDQPGNEFGNFLEGQLFKRFLDSPPSKPSKEFLHSIRENNYSGVGQSFGSIALVAGFLGRIAAGGLFIVFTGALI
jgi:uncharacterized membrane protein YphA (DoxX/SURF4 family)